MEYRAEGLDRRSRFGIGVHLGGVERAADDLRREERRGDCGVGFEILFNGGDLEVLPISKRRASGMMAENEPDRHRPMKETNRIGSVRRMKNRCLTFDDDEIVLLISFVNEAFDEAGCEVGRGPVDTDTAPGDGDPGLPRRDRPGVVLPAPRNGERARPVGASGRREFRRSGSAVASRPAMHAQRRSLPVSTWPPLPHPFQLRA